MARPILTKMNGKILLCVLITVVISCKNDSDVFPAQFSKIPDYEWVFPEEKVRTITIQLGQENWDKIQKDMEWRTARKFGSASTIPGATPPAGAPLDAVYGDPIFVKAQVQQGDHTWKNVGFRLKGNASLNGSWRSGIYKLPFKLKFDEWEDQNPDIRNQRFYGFQELSFAPSYGDDTFLKEKLLTQLFRNSGVMACKVAYYKVIIDFGQGLRNCGVYQAIEAVEEHMVETQSGKKVGNVYKPESNMQQFLISQFEKQNNQTLADYSDVRQLITTLNSPLRVSDNAQWKKELESIFDVKEFLRYLAVNNTVGNWDSYGVLTHNYFLVNTDGVLHWVPYDLNLSFQMRGGANNSRFALSMDMKAVTSQWPLIRYIVDDPAYFAYYKAAVKTFIEKDFTPTTMGAYIKKHKAVLQPYFTGTGVEAPPYSHLRSPQNVDVALTDLEKYINERYQVALGF